MTLVLVVLVFIVAPLAAVALGPWFASPEEDERFSRIDRELDRDEMRRRIGGHRW